MARMHPLDSINDRVWWALHALPRGADGRHPPMTSVETSVKPRVSQGTLSKLCKGDRTYVNPGTLAKLAEALRVSQEWIMLGKGEPPELTGPIADRRATYGIRDALADAVAAYVAPRNNFDTAVQTLGPTLDEEAVREVAAEALGHENERPPHHWGKRLQEAHNRRNPPRPPTPPAPKVKPKADAPAKAPGTVEKRRRHVG